MTATIYQFPMFASTAFERPSTPAPTLADAAFVYAFMLMAGMFAVPSARKDLYLAVRKLHCDDVLTDGVWRVEYRDAEGSHRPHYRVLVEGCELARLYAYSRKRDDRHIIDVAQGELVDLLTAYGALVDAGKRRMLVGALAGYDVEDDVEQMKMSA